MAEFIAVVNDTNPKNGGKSYALKITGNNHAQLLGKRIGDVVDGIFVGEGEQTLFNTDHHPDFYLLDRDKIYLKDIIKQKKESKYWDDEKGYKDVVSFLTLTPSISKNKVVCIMNADSMNEESQNALLKSLEEPASYSYIIMTTSRPKSLKQTIYKRKQLGVNKSIGNVVIDELS